MYNHTRHLFSTMDYFTQYIKFNKLEIAFDLDTHIKTFKRIIICVIILSKKKGACLKNRNLYTSRRRIHLMY